MSSVAHTPAPPCISVASNATADESVVSYLVDKDSRIETDEAYLSVQISNESSITVSNGEITRPCFSNRAPIAICVREISDSYTSSLYTN